MPLKLRVQERGERLVELQECSSYKIGIQSISIIGSLAVEIQSQRTSSNIPISNITATSVDLLASSKRRRGSIIAVELYSVFWNDLGQSTT